jgi:hypothetical protein
LKVGIEFSPLEGWLPGGWFFLDGFSVWPAPLDFRCWGA